MYNAPDEMLVEVIMETSCNPWESSVLLLKNLNVASVKDAYPLLCIDDLKGEFIR